jgi:hypothetical protein
METYEQKHQISYYKCYKDFEKALYLPTKKARLDAIKKIIADPEKNNPINGNRGTLCGSNELPESFLFGELITTEKRILEVEIYLDELFERAKIDPENEINFLIDNRYSTHKDVFSNDIENKHFHNEVNAYIIDKITEYIKSVRKDVERDKIDIQKSGLTQKQRVLLLYELVKSKIINLPNENEINTTDLVSIIGELINIPTTTPVKNSTIYTLWKSVNSVNDTRKVNTLENQNVIRGYLQVIEIVSNRK